MSAGITFEPPCFLISGLGNDFSVYVQDGSSWILLSTDRFTPVAGLCRVIMVLERFLPPPKPQFFGAESSLVVAPDGWGIVQRLPNEDLLKVSMIVDGGNDKSVTFNPINPPADFVDPTEDATQSPDTPPFGKIFINGGGVWNGIKGSLINFIYTVNGGAPTASSVAGFGQESGPLLNNATITSFVIRLPSAKGYWPLNNFKMEDGMSLVVLQKVPGVYYVAAMVVDGPIPIVGLTDILQTSS